MGSLEFEELVNIYLLSFTGANNQGTRTGTGPRSRGFNLGILGDFLTHKYPRDVGLISSGFPMTGYVGLGVHPTNFPENGKNSLLQLPGV